MEIYLDNAATTKPSDECLKDYIEAAKKYWANPSSVYQPAIEARTAIEHAREQCAKSINADLEEIIFTSGGSEGNNMLIHGIEYYYENPTYFYSQLEHPSMFKAIESTVGSTLVDIPVRQDGLINLDVLEHSLKYVRYSYNFVVVQLANNEIGTIQDIKDISTIAHNYHARVIVDAVQAYMHIPIDVKEMGIDAMVVSGHKFGALRGTGFIYLNKRLKIAPMIWGGHQEIDMRAGTENTAGIVALGNQVERICEKDIEHSMSRTESARKDLLIAISNMCKKNDWHYTVNGSYFNRLPNNLSITFEGVKASDLVTLLGDRGIYISAGSACSSGESVPSKTLIAIGLTDDEARSTVRLTMNDILTPSQIEYIKENLEVCIKILK